jgi:anti-anti-sigma regulatory factor
MDSNGLSELLGAIRATHEEGGSIAIASIRPEMIQALRTAGLDRLVYLAGSPLEAVGWLNQEREGKRRPGSMTPLRS